MIKKYPSKRSKALQKAKNKKAKIEFIFNGKDLQFIQDLEDRIERYCYFETRRTKSAEMWGRMEGLREAILVFKKFYCA